MFLHRLKFGRVSYACRVCGIDICIVRRWRRCRDIDIRNNERHTPTRLTAGSASSTGLAQPLRRIQGKWCYCKFPSLRFLRRPQCYTVAVRIALFDWVFLRAAFPTAIGSAAYLFAWKNASANPGGVIARKSASVCGRAHANCGIRDCDDLCRYA